LFFDSKDSEGPISNINPASEYLFEKSVSQQYDTAIEPFEIAQTYARCQVWLAITAEGLKQSDENMHSKLIVSSNTSKHMAERLLLTNIYLNKSTYQILSQDMKSEFIDEAITESQKYATYYKNLYDAMMTETVTMLKQGRKYSESTQKAYQDDLKTCIDMSSAAAPEAIPLTELIDMLSEPTPQPKIISDIIGQYPYKLSLVEIKSELTNETMKETVMRCGGILQAFVNGVPNEGTKIPEPVERFAALYLIAISIHKEKLGVANRVMAEFKKHEKSYTPWLKNRKVMLSDKNRDDASIILSLLDDESQCLELTDMVYDKL
jgi:hypothetical protein